MFDWDAENLAHIARHNVSQSEAEEICTFDSLALDIYSVADEIRFEEIGPTKAGRILKVVTTERGDKIRIVTAFDASPEDKRTFARSLRRQ